MMADIRMLGRITRRGGRGGESPFHIVSGNVGSVVRRLHMVLNRGVGLRPASPPRPPRHRLQLDQYELTPFCLVRHSESSAEAEGRPSWAGRSPRFQEATPFESSSLSIGRQILGDVISICTY